MPAVIRTPPRVAATAAAIGWFLGLYGVPVFHNLNHRDDHTHGPTPPAEHHHPHEHGHGHDGRVPVDSNHGIGSVLHFAAAAIGAQTIALPSIGPRIPLPPPQSPRPAPSTPPRIVLVRGPPLVDVI